MSMFKAWDLGCGGTLCSRGRGSCRTKEASYGGGEIHINIVSTSQLVLSRPLFITIQNIICSLLG